MESHRGRYDTRQGSFLKQFISYYFVIAKYVKVFESLVLKRLRYQDVLVYFWMGLGSLIRHKGLIYRLEKDISLLFSKIPQSYLSQSKTQRQISGINISAEMSLGLCYVLYTSDIPQDSETTMFSFVDDTDINGFGRYSGVKLQ